MLGIMIISETMRKHRIFGIDILRIVCALLIYMRHSITMFGCTYGSDSIDDFIVGTTSPVMSLFFIMSGFSIYYNNKVTDWNTKEVIEFYKKRAIQIVPTFMLIHILWLFLGQDTVAKWVVLTPLSVSGLQSMFPNLFGVLHNGGTWFISCILIAYFTFPISSGIIDTMRKRTKWIMMVIMLLAVIYFPAVGGHYSLGVLYINPVFRSLEFTFGVCLCAAYSSTDNLKSVFSKGILLVLLIVATWALWHSIMYQSATPITGVYTVTLIQYIWFAIALYVSFITRCETLEKNKVINYASGLTYYFFIFQLILWVVTSWVIGLIEPYWGSFLGMNAIKLLSSFVICILIAVTVNELYDKPIKNYLKSRLLRKAE